MADAAENLCLLSLNYYTSCFSMKARCFAQPNYRFSADCADGIVGAELSQFSKVLGAVAASVTKYAQRSPKPQTVEAQDTLQMREDILRPSCAVSRISLNAWKPCNCEQIAHTSYQRRTKLHQSPERKCAPRLIWLLTKNCTACWV
jgi:hypothetical protein